MTALTATLVKADQYKLTYLLTGDGSDVDVTIANATLLADAVGGPLKNALNKTYTVAGVGDQPTMRHTFGEGPVKMTIRGRSTTQLLGVDVDTDAVTTTKVEINVVGAVALAVSETAYLDIMFCHSRGR
jgi:hypothetical protein